MPLALHIALSDLHVSTNDVPILKLPPIYPSLSANTKEACTRFIREDFKIRVEGGWFRMISLTEFGVTISRVW